MILTMTTPVMAAPTATLSQNTATVTSLSRKKALKQAKAKAVIHKKKKKSSKVYITKTGKKYHSRKGCRGLNNARKIYSTTKKKAKNKGLKPCKLCY